MDLGVPGMNGFIGSGVVGTVCGASPAGCLGVFLDTQIHKNHTIGHPKSFRGIPKSIAVKQIIE